MACPTSWIAGYCITDHTSAHLWLCRLSKLVALKNATIVKNVTFGQQMRTLPLSRGESISAVRPAILDFTATPSHCIASLRFKNGPVLCLDGQLGVQVCLTQNEW